MWWFLGGLVVGAFVTAIGVLRLTAGKLKFAREDPYSDPYLFLELSKSMDFVRTKHYVLLEVDTNEVYSRD